MNSLQRLLSHFFLSARKSDRKHYNPVDMFQSNSIRTKEGSIYFYQYIPSKITNLTKCIFLLHGNSDDRKSFLKNYEMTSKIDKDHIYIVPDYRGFGESSLSFDIKYVLMDLFACIYYINNVHKITKYVIIGQSLGGTIALLLVNFFNSKRNLCKKHKLEYNLFTNSLDYRYSVHYNGDENKVAYDQDIEIERTLAFSPFYSTERIVEDHLKKYIRIHSLRSYLISRMISKEIDLNFSMCKTEGFLENVDIFVADRDDIVNPYHSSLLNKAFGLRVTTIHGKGHIGLFKTFIFWNKY